MTVRLMECLRAKINHYRSPTLGRNGSALILPGIIQPLAENSLGWQGLGERGCVGGDGKEKSSESNAVDPKSVAAAGFWLTTLLAADLPPMTASVPFYITYFK